MLSSKGQELLSLSCPNTCEGFQESLTNQWRKVKEELVAES